MFGIYSFSAGLLLFAVRVLIPHSIQLCLDSYYHKSAATGGIQDDLSHLDKIPHRFSSQKHEKKKKGLFIVWIYLHICCMFLILLRKQMSIIVAVVLCCVLITYVCLKTAWLHFQSVQSVLYYLLINVFWILIIFQTKPQPFLYSCEIIPRIISYINEKSLK